MAKQGDELDRLCAHSYEVLIVPTGAASPGVRADFMSSCRVGASSKREALGEAAWSQRIGCIMAGETSDELGRCDGREPKPEPEPSAEPDISATMVCEQLLKIMENELGVGLFPDAERPRYLRECAEQLAPEIGADPQQYERQARCILRAETMEDLEACEL